MIAASSAPSMVNSSQEFCFRRFDAECTALLDQCFYKSERITKVCLEINYASLIYEHESEVEDFVELMFVASLGKAQVSSCRGPTYNWKLAGLFLNFFRLR